jgi:lipopolysaccharide assembly outer membrane protein LptD (OstA)
MKRLLIFIFCFGLMYPVLSPSQESDPAGSQQSEQSSYPKAPDDSVYHLSSGSVSSRDSLGERVTEFLRGVKIVHGNVTVTARRGFQFSDQRLTHLLGDVTIVQEGLQMRGDRGEYNRYEDRGVLSQNVKITDRGWDITCDRAILFKESGLAWLIGRVVASDSTTLLKADTLYYDRNLSTAEAFGRVSVTSRVEGFTALGDHGFYFRDTREGMIDRNPHLIVDLDSPEPATVDSDTMRFTPDSKHAVAHGRVKIIKGSTVTQCDSAAIFDEENRAELYGNPMAKQENVSMEGDRMALHYTDDEVDRIDIGGSARIDELQRDSLIVGRDSWIQGDSMSLYIRNNRVDSIRVIGNSASEYYPAAVNRVESNLARGDTMFFHFEKDTLSYVRINGRSQGTYSYLDLAEGETCDSLRAVMDTTLSYRPFRQEAEAVVYSARRIEYFARDKDIKLDDKAKVVYQDRTLLGKHIVYHSTLQLLDATGSPILIEGSEKFYGEEMGYDLENGVGIVKKGSTQFMEGFYTGEQVAKVGDNVMKVWNSTYTTCDLKKPHYHFASKEMKVYLKDKIVSGSIVLYIGETPIGFLPFLANNLRKGRRSGILRPDFEFGITKSTGRYIRNFGYFWATNDYTDFQVIGDFRENSDFTMNFQNRYKLRYRFDGNVNLSLQRNLDSFSNKWIMSSRHSHNLGDKFSLASDLRFVSDDKALQSISNIDDVQNVIDRRIESKISLRKSWTSVGFSASGRRVQKLNITDPNAVRVETTLPSVSLSIPSRSLYFGRKTVKGDKPFLERFLGGIRYSPGVSGSRTTQERKYEFKETINTRLSLGFSSPQKIGFLTVSPSLSMRDNYTRTETTVDAHTEISSWAVPETTQVSDSRHVDSENLFRWSTGASANTNFYGTFYPELGALLGVRHTVTPRVNYSYQPGLGSQPANQRFGVELKNAVDLKMRDGDKERKLPGVFIWTLSSNYDPQAPKHRGWSNVSSSINLKLLGTSVSMQQTIQPYDREILSASISSSVSLHGKHGFGSSSGDDEQELNVVASDTTEGRSVTVETLSGGGEQGGEFVPRDGAGNTWNLNMSISFHKPQFGDISSTLNANGNIKLTRNWKINYSASYNVEQRLLMGQRFSIDRDLHCWQMSFSRQRYGNEWDYYFRISIKAHPEIYSESGRRGLGGGTVGLPFSY